MGGISPAELMMSSRLIRVASEGRRKPMGPKVLMAGGATREVRANSGSITRSRTMNSFML